MQLQKKALEKLREIINGDQLAESHRRSGPKLVAFFNNLGFSDTYGQWFPSRWMYTDEKLKSINGTPEMDKCIRETFAVADFIAEIPLLDNLIADFNKYLALDKWQVVRNNDVITFKRLDKVIIKASTEVSSAYSYADFMKVTFDANLESVQIESAVLGILKKRMEEIVSCVKNRASLAAVILIGSMLEGLLLGVATSNTNVFIQASSSPKDKNKKVKEFQLWKLKDFIDVATELGILNVDVQKFSHIVREFRNYIHPYQQLSTRFTPSQETAEICLQVLKATIVQISAYQNHT